MPNPAEVAKLTVENMSFEDWDTVWVQHRWMDGWPLFRFSCAERSPQLMDWKLMKFRPGNRCRIELGGILAITGIITQRQTTYDAKNHGVLLSGVGQQWASATSSVNSEHGNFDGMTLEQIVKKVIESAGGKVEVIGKVDQTPFNGGAQATPGEYNFDFLDRIARDRKASLGSDEKGNTLLIGEHTGQVQQQLVEGENVLKMQCVFSIELKAGIYRMIAQKRVEDGVPPRESTEMKSDITGTLKNVFRYRQNVMEHPVREQAEVDMRNNYDAIYNEGAEVRVYATVQGWLRDGRVLWRTGDNVWVKSPMAMLDLILKVQSATFTQDDRTGTTTVLELVLPWMLNDGIWKMSPPGSPQPPPKASGVATTAFIDPTAIISI